ncbi:MAG: glutathione S-transferase family protein [Achromobacter sp.]
MTIPTLHLYTDSSPNGFKITIALEELALPYTLHHVRIEEGEHRHPDFLALNPHGRIPVLHDAAAGITVFESAAILLYLADKTGRLLPVDAKGRWEAITWLMFHSASMGPLLGQRVHAERFAAERHDAAIERFRRLTEDTFAVLDARLAQHPWLAGDTYSIADIATFGWLHIARIVEFDFSRHERLSAWHHRASQRPAVQRGITLPHPAVGP